MKKKFDIKSMLAGLIVGVGIFGCATAASTLVTGNVYFSPFPIIANGKSYASNSAILNYMGTTYVPLKELGELAGAKVTFNNNTIYVTSNTTTGSTNVTTTLTDMNLKKGAKDTAYVNLSKYSAKNATVSYSGSAIKISGTYFTYNGTVAVEAVKEGKSTITIRYNTGAVEYVNVTVGNDGEENLEIEKGDYDYIDIDLDEYDADKATLSITKGSSYITLGKTTVTKNTEVKVTGKKEGSATIKIKYDSGDTEYVYVEVVDDDDDDEDELEIEVDDYDYIDIDLDEYDADKATLSITKGSSYITLGKTTVTKNTEVKVTGKKEGSATIKIKYDSGDTEYVYVEVVEEYDDDDEDYEEEFEIEEGDYEYFEIDLDEYNADKATLSITKGSSYITLGKTKLTKNGKVRIDAEAEGKATIKIKYDTGDTELVLVKVVEKEDIYDYDEFEYVKELEVDVEDYDTYYINLEKYDATSAKLSVISGKSRISLGKTELTKSDDVKIYGDEEGESIVKVEFNTGKVIYLWIEVSE